MATLKTTQTDASVEAYLNSIEDPARRTDCKAITELMRRVTTHEPKMWGTSIVGFGSYHYKYESGHEGDMCLVGLSSRKAQISLYLSAGFAGRDRLLSELGTHKTAKACIYIKRLSDIKTAVLERLVAESIRARKHLNSC